jgi:hypothetical protein
MMPKTRSTRSRSGRYGSTRVSEPSRRKGSRGRLPGDHRGSNGGSRSHDHDDEIRGERNFVKRVGSKFSEIDLEKAMVLLHTALAVAIVIKQSKSRSSPRKAEPFRSAVSVLNHYLNEGRELTEMQRATLADIKEELRMLNEREDDEMMSPAR